MSLVDEHNMTGRRVRVNLILRGTARTQQKVVSLGSERTRVMAFGFILDLPVEEMMRLSEGKDVHLLAEVTIDRAGSVTAAETWNHSPEDILERGIPAFSSHGR